MIGDVLGKEQERGAQDCQHMAKESDTVQRVSARAKTQQQHRQQ